MQGFIRILVIACISMATVSQAKHLDEDTIDERTRPVGQVNIEGMEKVQIIAEEEPAVVQVATDDRTGETIYNGLCVACHSIGLANAPKKGDSAAWEKLMVNGIDALVSSAKKGKNVMPPMGTCADCSDEELKNTILFMINSND